MIGEKFGSLTVLRLDEEKNNQLKLERKQGLRSNAPVYYICQCDCGNILSLAKQKIKNRKEYGCKKCKNIEFNKYIGMKINKWLILDYINKNNNHYFLCQCDCGTKKEVNCYNIINEKSKDCGCGRKQTVSTILSRNIIGEKFGRLTVIDKIGTNKFGKTLFRCKCDCGNDCVAIYSSLISGHTISCGCIHSKMNAKIKLYLKELDVDFEDEKFIRYNDNEYGKFDFYLPLYNLVIEFDGEDHYMPIDRAGKGKEWAEEHFEITKYRDSLKNDYCKNNNINLLRIPYWEKENYKTLIKNKINNITLND